MSRMWHGRDFGGERTIRRLFTVLSIGSLVLFGLTLLALLSPNDWHLTLFNGGGGIGSGSALPTYVIVAGPRCLGIGWTHSDIWFEGMIGCPPWAALLAFLILPVLWVVRAGKKCKPPVGLCRQCGYDLAG